MAKLINEACALESFRCSDFDVYSAYGEIIDNSLQANATWVKIKSKKIRLQQRGRAYNKIEEIAFSDNGCGMNKETINNCLAMGYSSRYNDRDGIGRFGVGMTLASINQCKRVEVYSRESNGKWHWTYADLDEITSGEMEEIPDAKVVDLPAEYEDIASTNSGTIVIWSKYDRQPETADKIEDEMKIWFGRTYRYFIWDGVDIFVNGDKIKAIDPLYVKVDKTRFPNDPIAEELKEPIVFPWETMKNEGDSIPDEANVTIRMSLLPYEFRKEQGAGGSRDTKDRFIDRNEGISIIRNKREVFYGVIPHYSPQFKEIDRWWGCEISFSAVLDNAFTVKNIKRGALPTPELRQEIKKYIEEIRKKYIEEVQEAWRKNEAANLNPGKKGSPHVPAMNVIKGTSVPKNPKSDSTPNTPPTIPGILEPIDTEEYPITIVEGNWEGSNFFTRKHKGGQIVLAYNTSHQFYEELEKIKKAIDVQYGNNSKLYRDLITLMNLLLASFSKSEAMLDGMPNSSPSIFAENIRNNWGMYLRQFISTWQEKKEILSKNE